MTQQCAPTISSALKLCLISAVWASQNQLLKYWQWFLNKTVYRIRTGHGLSTRTYQADATPCVLGTGQGSCASPSIWVPVLDPILWSIATKFTWFQIDTPLNKTIDRIGDAYIDDTALMATSNSHATNSTAAEVKLTAHVENITQYFERKLFSTGGRLNLKNVSGTWFPGDGIWTGLPRWPPLINSRRIKYDARLYVFWKKYSWQE